MNRLFLLFFLFLAPGILPAQKRAAADTTDESEHLKVLGRHRKGAVELKWYPRSAGSWRKLAALGVTVKRMELSDAGSAAGYKQLGVIKAYTAEEWRQKTNLKNPFVKTAMESMTPVKAVAGQPLTERQNDEQMMFFTYVMAVSYSSEAAKGAGLLYTDNTIERGKKYVYSISINSTKTKDPDDETLFFFTDTETEYTAPAAQGFNAAEGEGTVKLTWDNARNREFFTGYNIERSADGGRTFTKLNKHPFLSVSKEAEELEYTDSVKNYVPYHYRIVGITAWSDPGTPSEAIRAMGRDKTPASPPMNVRARGDRSKILVTWELPATTRDLKGFLVGRSNKLEGPFNPISDEMKLISNGQRLFVDEKPSPKEPYYAVYSVDTANNLSSTFSVMASVYDTVGPAKPMGIRGTIDTNGVVKLNWEKGNDIDLVGYQVYTANRKENIFRQLTGTAIADPSFMDTVSMASLTEEVYYKITAVDYNNNPSDYSDLVVLKRQDRIAPAAPVIKDYSTRGKYIILTMVPSSSDDVISHKLIRTDDAGGTKVLAEMRQWNASYTDTSAKEGMSYSYMLTAVDDAGLQTNSKPLRISVQEEEVKAGVAGLTARVEERDKTVWLQWNAPAGLPAYTVVLFRSVNGADMEWYKKIPSGTQRFSEQVEPGQYSYAIKLLYASGAESELSQPAAITLR